MNPDIPTANRYIGAYTNGEVKVRGLEVRRGDIPLFTRKVQGEVIDLMSKASSIEELKSFVPAIMDIVRYHLDLLKNGRVPPLELVVRHTISKEADEYENKSMQAVVAQTMKEAGVPLKPGETAEYIIIDASGKKNPEKAKPFILYRTEDGCDVEKYTELTVKAIEVLLDPLGYTYEKIMELAAGCTIAKGKGSKKKKRAATDAGQDTVCSLQRSRDDSLIASLDLRLLYFVQLVKLKSHITIFRNTERGYELSPPVNLVEPVRIPGVDNLSEGIVESLY